MVILSSCTLLLTLLQDGHTPYVIALRSANPDMVEYAKSLKHDTAAATDPPDAPPADYDVTAPTSRAAVNNSETSVTSSVFPVNMRIQSWEDVLTQSRGDVAAPTSGSVSRQQNKVSGR